MPTTRSATKAQDEDTHQQKLTEVGVTVGTKREAETEEDPKSGANYRNDGETKEDEVKEPPAKKAKTEAKDGDDVKAKAKPSGHVDYSPKVGVIERGHIYFFYKPRVELEEAHDLDEVQRFHVLLVPRPPAFATEETSDGAKPEKDEDAEMKLLSEGADAVPSAEPRDKASKKFRLISIGKKQLPHPDQAGAGGRKQTLWGTVSTVGEDLHKFEQGMGAKQYETKTRGTRHQASARLAGRGVYAIVNNDPTTPSKRTTHLGYHLSHPKEQGEVQTELGIYSASSFSLQLRNPLAPVSGGQRVGMSQSNRAEYPEEVMQTVFGRGEKGTDESVGLRFSTINTAELLDFEGAEVIFIAAHGGEDGLEKSLGEGRGQALTEAAEKDKEESLDDVFAELALDVEKFPAEALEGNWI